jgi:hypothetical protein
MTMPGLKEGYPEDTRDEHLVTLKRVMMNVRGDLRDPSEVEIKTLASFHLDKLSTLPTADLNILENLQKVLNILLQNVLAAQDYSNLDTYLSRTFEKIRDEIRDFIFSTAHKEMLSDQANIMRIEDLKSELDKKANEGNLTNQEKTRLREHVKQIMMHIRKDPRRSEDVTINSLRKSYYQKLKGLDHLVQSELIDLQKLLAFIDTVARKPKQSDLEMMDGLLGVLKTEFIEHSKEMSKVGGIDLHKEEHLEHDEITKLEDILMFLPKDGDLSKLSDEDREGLLDRMKRLFMEIRGDHRDPIEVDVQDVLDVDVGSLYIEGDKKKNLGTLQKAMNDLYNRKKDGAGLGKLLFGLKAELKAEEHYSPAEAKSIRQLEAHEDSIKLKIEKIMQEVPAPGEKPLTESQIARLKDEVKDLMLEVRGDTRDHKKVDPTECAKWNLDVLGDSLPEWKLRDLGLLQKVLKF